MSELVKEFWIVTHYDECLHNCNDGGWGVMFGKNKCNCPIGKPYIEKHSFMSFNLFEAYGIPYNPDGMPRNKALEILNAWNNHAARDGVEGHSHWQDEKGKLIKVTTQYPARWVHFLDEPQWLLDANKEHHRKFSAEYESNKEREKEEIAKRGLAMQWIYHDKIESFIVPLEICVRAPHYADQIPKDSPTEHFDKQHGWGEETWICPDCKQRFTLAENWKEWKRQN